MTDTDALYILAAWFSPAYPVGGFSYSHGLEYALEAGLMRDRASAEALIADILRHGAGQLDARLLAASFRAGLQHDMARLKDIAELAAAFSATRELALETQGQGAAFLKVSRDCWPAPLLEEFVALWPGPTAYPVAVGVVAAAHELPLEPTLTAYLHGFSANLVSAAVRLVPLGQTDGQKITASLRPLVAQITAAVATDAGLGEDLASSTLTIDWCSMQHEEQYTRLFRS